jgi:photosystem II stability/assembly factor-like uncharacterized protein
MPIVDVSPTVDTTTIAISRLVQSVSGKALCVATSTDGMRAYLGGHSGVWRSDDGGANWFQPQRPQPGPNVTAVPGALMVPNVYDLVVSPGNANLVLAATGSDPRRPSQSGIYRSTDGATTWQLVHQFGAASNIRKVCRLAVAPDDPQRMYAAGESAVGISTDGGLTWNESVHQPFAGQAIRHVVVGTQQAALRHVYAVGTRVWHSRDGGLNWRQDPVNLSLSAPSDSLGASSHALTLHPTNASVIYLNANGAIWRGDFRDADAAGGAIWRQLPSIPIGFPSTTASGTDYIVAHITPQGQLLLFASDRRTAHVSIGEPRSESDWRRIDGDPVHVDPHNLAVTPDFQLAPNARGRVFMVNDGGVNWSNDGTANWRQGLGLSTLGIVNAAVLPRVDKEPAICIGMGDNSGFFSPDGGRTWRTQDYLGGDNDACFADPRQPSRLIVFAPRTVLKGLFLYATGPGSVPNGALGTADKTEIPGPPPMSSSETRAGWNATSGPYNFGYRPIVHTLKGEQPRPDGDFVTIIYTGPRAFVVRTTTLSQINAPGDWLASATAEGPGVKAFRQGPDLPSARINAIQAAGGHASPTFYAGDPDGSQSLWKWTAGMAAWEQLIPGPGGSSATRPSTAQRFFVDPYRPQIIYVLDQNHVWRSDTGGRRWTVDTALEGALTENGAFPFVIPADGNPGQALLRDMHFDWERQGYRFALGPAGVFYTLDGRDWDHLLLTSALPMRPNNAFYDDVSDPCGRALYVATNNRGLLRLGPLPPEWEHPLGAVVATQGRVTLLRVHDVDTGFGPPSDLLDAEVIVQLDSEPQKSFGFQLRGGGDEAARKGMLDALRDVFSANSRVRIEYVRVGCRSGEIIRVIELT